MPTTGVVQDMIEERKKQKENALSKLSQFSLQKLTLKRPVFFVPGWTDEDNTWWTVSNKKFGISIKEWFSGIFKNCDLVEYVTFSDDESKRCKSFLDFGVILKNKILSKIEESQDFDLVGHSMGGLDAVAAVIDDVSPLLKVNSLITVATPHEGRELADLLPKLKKGELHHMMQCVNLDPDQFPIKYINEIGTREKLLNRVKKLYCFAGTIDLAVMRSAKYNKEGLDPDFYKSKVEIIEVSGASHTEKNGITLDPRTTLAIAYVLLGIEIKFGLNYGNFTGGVYTPFDDKGVFI
ncbi:MAG: hypothetical protein NTW18_05045 [Candidatus Omnitrophica bacterium]|nr:hypothetical protein [Candidatus Omnitrophota bacterium]